MRPGLAFLALLGAVTVPRAAAQAPALTVIVQSGVPRIQTTGLLADGKFVGLMRSGFPLRLHYRLELWRSRSGWFDQYISEASWDGVARHDPLADDFVLIRTGGSVTRYGTPDDLERGLELPYRVNLKVKGSGNFYFLCRLDVTTLNDTDLEELTRYVQPQRKLGAEPLVDRAADLVERAALRSEPRREHRLAHADVALRAVVGLEAGEQRAMPEMFGALAVAMDAVEHLWSLARSRVRFRGPGAIQHRARGHDPLGRHSRAGLGVHDPPASTRRHEQPHSRRPRHPCDDPGELRGHSASSVANTSPP